MLKAIAHLALALAAGCGQDASPQSLDESPADASSARDAQAPSPVDVTCEASTTETSDGDGRRTRSVQFNARVDVGDPRDFPSFRVLSCDRETAATPMAFDCALAEGTGLFSEGKLLVNCGSETWTAEPGADFVRTYFDRYRTVRILRD